MTRQVHTGPHIAMQDCRPPNALNGVIHCQTVPCKTEQGLAGPSRAMQWHMLLRMTVNKKQILTGSLDHKETERAKRARLFRNEP